MIIAEVYKSGKVMLEVTSRECGNCLEIAEFERIKGCKLYQIDSRRKSIQTISNKDLMNLCKDLEEKAKVYYGPNFKLVEYVLYGR